MVFLRSVEKKDFPAVLSLAKELDSYNLPDDPKVIRNLIRTSVLSFQGKLPRTKAKYLFVIEEEISKKIFGSSLIIARQGTPSSPHIYLEKGRDRKGGYLKFGATKQGPTEIGGLVLKKAYRRRKEKFGKQLSWARFLYMALHPERFERQVLAEFLPPLQKRKGSLFWDAFGRRFTGLSYREGDRLSVYTKKFIFDLFPKGKVYLSHFPKKVRALLGKVGKEAIPACRMLQAIGFHPNGRIEPFDGGPYYEVERKKISVIRKAKKFRFQKGKVPRRGKVMAYVAQDFLKMKEGRKIIAVPFE
ncbi:MAG: arginine N-succinyltransferase [Candidatus Omnitrophica bacterium]|nr:arginine N-succinyltransferase [Candidatus Omnitrophota bacterium]